MRWWHEVIIIAAFYFLYSLIRDIHGDNTDSIVRATTNAHRVIRVERFFGIFHEAQVQHWFIHDTAFMKFWDDYYGTVHFVMVALVLLLLFFVWPPRYRLWRNTLAITTGLALVGFNWFPLLPPRLLPAHYHIVDTLQVIGGLWNFSSGPVNDVSNQYAAMPSLHTAWSTWCAVALMGAIRPWWGKVLVLLYPACTIFCIVVTGNHYFLDAVGGLVTLGVAFLISWWVTPRFDRWRINRAAGGRAEKPARLRAVQ